ncbi:MAG: amidohydrolase [Deltaproteobacteria bacterium HGW-Deltaproteobacteria-19]|nr:MAG: amidohydrolase [Deltaproteobacteria bacterium HGW-Deltaproteobacteria-19]
MNCEPLDLLVTGGTLLTMNGTMDLLENPVIGIREGRIVFVKSGTAEMPEARERLDAKGCTILPGLVNTHTHAAMVCFRGLADDLPLMEWLERHIWPAEAKYVNREMVYAGTSLAIAEMILSGTTTFCDSYFYSGSAARAAVDAGMRGVIAQGFIDFPTPDSPDPSRQIEIAEKFVGTWRDRSPLVTPSLFCHTPYTCSTGTLTTIKETARRIGVPFQTHLSETREEVHIIRERFGKSPVQYLDSIGVLDEKTIAVHCNWIEEDELDLMATRGVKVSHNPESNLKLASGMAPVPKMLRRGIAVGLGTDGCASNNDLDLFGEIGTAAKIHKLTEMDPTAMDAATVLRMATIEGAKVLGLEREIGSVEPGKWADLILIDMEKPHFTPLYNLYSHLVYAAQGSDVTTAIVGGKVVMKDRRLLTIDLPAVMEEVRRIGRTIQTDRTVKP